MIKVSNTIAILGLGYVGLPLAFALAKHSKVYGIDTNVDRISNIVLQPATQSLLDEGNLQLASTIDQSIADIYIVTVPTPVDSFHIPDLSALKKASSMIANVLKKGDLVIYESTVYPGCTDDVCIPLLEVGSGLRINTDFGVAYSPERINPGDTIHTLEKIDKIISASNAYYLEKVEKLYKTIITATLFPVSSIKVAEAAKVIENAQRDLNISFMNELAFIFDRMGIDTNEVIDAASSKWNFLPFRPGLVGGHCIGVDPYYLTYKSQQLGYSPEVILSGRKVNNNMPFFIVNKVVKLLVQNNKTIQGAKILLLGFAFKENCEDFRNTRVVDMYQEFIDFGGIVTVVDPWVNEKQVYENHQIRIEKSIPNNKMFDAIVLTVAHNQFKEVNYAKYREDPSLVIFDTKNIIPKELVSGRL